MTANVPVGHERFGEVITCDCQQELGTQRRRAYLELPAALLSRTFETFGPRPDLAGSQALRLTAAFNAAQEYAQGEAAYQWLTFVGSIGWGKTHLAVAVLNARVAHPDWGPPGKYAFSPDLLKRLQNGFDDGTYQQTLNMYQDAPLLLIDDLGTEYRKRADGGLSWAEEQLFLILNHRYTSELPTIITSNTPADAINVRIRDRMMDTGTGLCAVFAETLPSYRSGQTLS